MEAKRSVFDTRLQAHVGLPLPNSGTLSRMIIDESQTVVILVGLPARGKTYTSKKLTRYLNWIGIYTKSFNLGEYRRELRKSDFASHDFFSENNLEAMKIRKRAAKHAFYEMSNWLHKVGDVAVFDATNTTRVRRQWIIDKCCEEKFQTLFIEVVCDDPTIIERNILEVKVNSPDYVGMEETVIMEDFRKRILEYEKVYEPIDANRDCNLSYICVCNQGTTCFFNKIHGHLQMKIAYYMLNMRVIYNRNIYICLHGETEFHLEGRMGGDLELNDRGVQFAKYLGEFVEGLNLESMKVWTCNSRRSVATSCNIDRRHSLDHNSSMNGLYLGVCDGLSYTEIEKGYPDEVRERDKDKFHHRYSGGESYQDLVARLEPLIMELEHIQNVLLICSLEVARCLLAYFLDKNHEELPYLDVPLHQIIKLSPAAYGCIMEVYPTNIPAVNTQRAKPPDVVSRTRMNSLLLKNRISFSKLKE